MSFAKLTSLVKVAVTVRAALMVTMHVPVPEHAPLQPSKVEPLDALAVSVTNVPLAYSSMQSFEVPPALIEQMMPAGFEPTVPAPVPAPFTVSWY